MRRFVHSLITLVVALYIGLIILALFSDRLLFQPQPSSYQDANLVAGAREIGVGDARVLKLQSSSYDGAKKAVPATITAIYLPNPSARFTLLFSHGNAEDIGADLPLFDIYRQAGFSVFAYDYRGYGTSGGRASEHGLYADAEAAYLALTGQLHVSALRIISVGRSLGSAAAIHIAATHPTAGLVVEAPFLSAFRVLTRVPLLPWDKFNNAAKIQQVHVPVLVIQGDADEVVPFRHGQRMFALAKEPKRSLWVHGAHHNDVLFTATSQYLDALRAFASALPQQN